MNTANEIINSAFTGLEVKDSENIELVNELLDKFRLRWSVSKQPLVLPDSTPTGFFGIVRDDIKKTFTTVKDGYTPYQNSELAELLIRIADKGGYEIHSGGMFNDGGKVFMQLNTCNEIKNLGANSTTVKGYATAINSHDGTNSLKWGAVTFTICCRNTFAMASKALQQSARHTASMHQKVEKSIREINGIAEVEKNLFDKFITLSEIPVNKTSIAEIVRTVTDVDINMAHAEASQKYSAYAINRSQELLSSISKEMKQKGETMWGLFSGVTHYTSHVMPAPKRDNARLESKYTGTGLSIDNNAYSKVLQLAGVN
ncbi:MAG TPA: DUF932 domain-containing protein [Chitinophagales bacterium]|nr:DUF932 domain-containing protein [Chitinophagales bacterium]